MPHALRPLHDARVWKVTPRRAEVFFALGNLVPALLLGVGLFALPVRWWPADLAIGTALVCLVGTSALVLGRPALARPALRVGAGVLLGAGLLLVAAALLSVAFLWGIHGDFGRGGVALMTLIALLVLPYTVGYPLLELAWLGPVRREPARPDPAPAAAPVEPADAGAERAADADGGASA